MPVWRWFQHVWATLRVALIGYFIAIALPLRSMLTRSKSLSAMPVSDPRRDTIDAYRCDRSDHHRVSGRRGRAPHRHHLPDRVLPARCIDCDRSDVDAARADRAFAQLRAPVWREFTQIRFPTPFPTSSRRSKYRSRFPSSARWWRSSSQPTKALAILSSSPPRSSSFRRRGRD